MGCGKIESIWHYGVAGRTTMVGKEDECLVIDGRHRPRPTSPRLVDKAS